MSLAQGMEAASLNAQSLKGQDNPIHRTSLHGRQSYGKGPTSGGDGNDQRPNSVTMERRFGQKWQVFIEVISPFHSDLSKSM